MEVISVPIARVISFLSTYEFTIARVVQYDLIRRIADRYHFEKPPAVDTLTSSTGTEFTSGIWNSIPISKLTLLVRGVGVETQTSTDDADAIVADLVPFISREIGSQPLRVALDRNAYFSGLSFISEAPLNRLHPALGKLSAEITTLLGARAAQQSYETTGITLHVDDSNLKYPPGKFTIERRTGIPFSENSYISAAPLRTQDHRRLLEELEAALLPS